jgi:hypothetical protein
LWITVTALKCPCNFNQQKKASPKAGFFEGKTELLLRLFLLRLGSRSSGWSSTSRRSGGRSSTCSRSGSVSRLGGIGRSRSRSSDGSRSGLGFFFLAAGCESHGDERSNEERLFHFIPFIGEECCNGYLMYLWLR